MKKFLVMLAMVLVVLALAMPSMALVKHGSPAWNQCMKYTGLYYHDTAGNVVYLNNDCLPNSHYLPVPIIGAQGPKGDKGDKGDRGDTGAQGDIGPGGEGSIGPQGPVGLTGPQGPQGIQGLQGENNGDIMTIVCNIDDLTSPITERWLPCTRDGLRVVPPEIEGWEVILSWNGEPLFALALGAHIYFYTPSQYE